MRFCDLFFEYKHEYKKLYKQQRSTITKIIIVFTPLFAISIIWLFTANQYFQLGSMVFDIGMIVFSYKYLKHLNDKDQLEKTYKPLSTKRMEMIAKLLHSYKIDFNSPEKLESLIKLSTSEAEKDKKNSVMEGFKKALISVTLLIFFPNIKTLVSKIESHIPFIIVILVIIVVIILLIFLSFIGQIIYVLSDYFYYDELKSDLQQFIVFKQEVDFKPKLPKRYKICSK